MTGLVSRTPVWTCLGLAALAWSTSACELFGVPPGGFMVRDAGVDVPDARGDREHLDGIDAGAVDAGGAIDAEPGDITYAVRGMAIGVTAPLALRLDHPDGNETVRVDEDGSFAFQARLADGADYAIALLDAPPCVVANGAGVVGAGDVEVELACEAVLLSALSVSGPAAPALPFDQARLEYTADVSLLRQSVQVTATAAHAASTIEIAGVPAESGAPSASLPLALGENPIEIVVRHPGGASRSYRVNLRREAAIAAYAYRTASHPGAGERFGYSVALWDDTLAVGAYHEGSAARGVLDEDPDGSAAADDSGAVYVFRRGVDGAWSQEAYLKASNAAAYAEFGASVALWGDTLAVSARGESSDTRGILHGNQPGTDNGRSRESGAVYVFRRGVNGAWSQEAYIKASNTGERDEFGQQVALRDDVLAVGAPHEDSSATGVNGPEDNDLAPNSGAVYVYRRQQGIWGQEAYVKPARTHAWDKFGVSVALGPDVLAVGAFLEDGGSTGVGGDPDVAGAPDSGAVYVFRRVGPDWTQEAYLKASNTGEGDELGHSVAMDGDTLVVGAPRENGSAAGNDEGACDSGAVYVFRYQDSAWTQAAYLKAPGAGVRDAFGRSLALAGDTLAVGAYDEGRASESDACSPDGGGIDEGGAVHVFQRAGGVWAHAARVEVNDPAAGDWLGWSVALWDGALVTGAPRRDAGAADAGAVHVFR